MCVLCSNNRALTHICVCISVLLCACRTTFENVMRVLYSNNRALPHICVCESVLLCACRTTCESVMRVLCSNNRALPHVYVCVCKSVLLCACRTTCENVMRVLRSNKESVTAMLEAFVHDPLINWRLLNTADATQEIVRGASEHGGVPATSADAGAGVWTLFRCVTIAPVRTSKMQRLQTQTHTHTHTHTHTRAHTRAHIDTNTRAHTRAHIDTNARTDMYTIINRPLSSFPSLPLLLTQL